VEVVAAPPRRLEAIEAQGAGLGGDAQGEAAARGAIVAPRLRDPILDDDREGGNASLGVRDLEDDPVVLLGVELLAEASPNLDASQRRLGEHAGEHEEGQHQREDEVEQVVARIERCEAHAEGDGEEGPASPRRSQRAGRAQPAPGPCEDPRLPCASLQSGTGV
jgi:hypothetical protein